MAPPDTKSLSWSRDNFLISTSPSLIQPQAINAAFDSEFMYWAKSMSEDGLAAMLTNSLCFGVYEIPTDAPPSLAASDEEDSTPSAAARPARQIGLARLITDHVTMAYLTDVYILPANQGKGLGTWLLRCVQETLDSWPELRGSLLYASQGKAAGVYGELMGVQPWVQGQDGLVICTRRFKGSGMEH